MDAIAFPIEKRGIYLLSKTAQALSEAYIKVRRRGKPAEDDAQWKKGRF